MTENSWGKSFRENVKCGHDQGSVYKVTSRDIWETDEYGIWGQGTGPEAYSPIVILKFIYCFTYTILFSYQFFKTDAVIRSL